MTSDKEGNVYVGTYPSCNVYKYSGTPLEWTKLIPQKIDPSSTSVENIFFSSSSLIMNVVEGRFYKYANQTLEDLGGAVYADFVITNHGYYHYEYESPASIAIYQYYFDPFHYELLFSLPASPSWAVAIARDEKNLKSYYGVSMGGATRLYQYDEGTKKVVDLGGGPDQSRLFNVALDGDGKIYGAVTTGIYVYLGLYQWKWIFASNGTLALSEVEGSVYASDNGLGYILKLKDGVFDLVAPQMEMLKWMISEIGELFVVGLDGTMYQFDAVSNIWVKIW
eukprot:TRINITY_DN26941_c0_g1_i1.p1 TRINITY_DN26941_c0_g1~~TRINITY_DN26941_c0_g1_i1.p1  ORF type:complete len:305 (+),score=89.68 TRINITY_DN26941_c0_g1_i1:77-916(+)